MRLASKRSRTAEAAAASRAAAARESDPAERNPDQLAERLIGRGYQFIVRVRWLRRAALQQLERFAPGMHLYHLARTRHFDSVLELELAAGTEQVVILGAGLDSRAHRFGAQLQGVRFYEVDHPHTSFWKQERVRARLPEANPDVRYVPVDLTTGELFRALERADFRAESKTFFLWEGGTMYLPEEAVRDLLGSIARLVPKSSIAFDYLHRSVFDAPRRFVGGSRNLAVVRLGGEPYVFGIDPIDVGPSCESLGFDVLSNLDAGALASRYLPPTKLGGGPRMLEFVGIVHARCNLHAHR